eukprot:TRINITY_DN1693_c0_g1_i2.p1 TRINITY_DN1693_c0_g1~~TRINITY_DN1693_c0_g1_i2.p1  ORF type:complete len:541 (+),score=187.20 TRINITY_DN1693_c0_g1_i2:195-1817(+)
MNILRRLSRTLSGLLIGPANVEDDVVVVEPEKTEEGGEEVAKETSGEGEADIALEDHAHEHKQAVDEAPGTSPIVESGSFGDTREHANTNGPVTDAGDSVVEVTVTKTIVATPQPLVEDIPSAGEEEPKAATVVVVQVEEEKEDPDQYDIEYKAGDVIDERPEEMEKEAPRQLKFSKYLQILLRDVVKTNKTAKATTDILLRNTTMEVVEDFTIDFAVVFLQDSKDHNPDKKLTYDDLHASVVRLVPPSDILDCSLDELQHSFNNYAKLKKQQDEKNAKKRRSSEPLTAASSSASPSPVVGEKRPRRASAIYKEESSASASPSPSSTLKKQKTAKGSKKSKKSKEIDVEVEQEKKPQPVVENYDYSDVQPKRLIFPIGEVMKLAKERGFNIDVTYAVGLAGLLDYFNSEALELGSTITINDKKVRVTPRHIYRGIVNDKEMADLLKGRIFAYAGRIYNADPSEPSNAPYVPLIKAENCHGELIIPRGNFQAFAEEILDSVSEKLPKKKTKRRKKQKKKKMRHMSFQILRLLPYKRLQKFT